MENKFEEALPHCKRAVELAENDFAVLDSLGFVYNGAGDDNRKYYKKGYYKKKDYYYKKT